jgi:hypothetical protein
MEIRRGRVRGLAWAGYAVFLKQFQSRRRHFGVLIADSAIFLSQRGVEIQCATEPGNGVRPVFRHYLGVERSGRTAIAISVILIAQYSLLGPSCFRPTGHFGMLCGVGLFSAQMITLQLLPGLRYRTPPQAVTAR